MAEKGGYHKAPPRAGRERTAMQGHRGPSTPQAIAPRLPPFDGGFEHRAERPALARLKRRFQGSGVVPDTTETLKRRGRPSFDTGPSRAVGLWARPQDEGMPGRKVCYRLRPNAPEAERLGEMSGLRQGPRGAALEGRIRVCRETGPGCLAPIMAGR